MEVLGDNVPLIHDVAGGTDISGVVRPPSSQPAMTHAYFIWSQNKRQDIAANATEGRNAQVIPQSQNLIQGHQIKQRIKWQLP